MPATQSFIGKGTTLGYGTPSGSTVTYTTIGEVKDVTPPHQTAEKYEATNYTSPNAYLEWLFGWKDGGEVSFKCNMVYANLSALYALLAVSQSWLITMPDGHTWTFTGTMIDIDPKLPNKGVCEVDFKVKVTGVPVAA